MSAVSRGGRFYFHLLVIGPAPNTAAGMPVIGGGPKLLLVLLEEQLPFDVQVRQLLELYLVLVVVRSRQ